MSEEIRRDQSDRQKQINLISISHRSVSLSVSDCFYNSCLRTPKLQYFEVHWRQSSTENPQNH